MKLVRSLALALSMTFVLVAASVAGTQAGFAGSAGSSPTIQAERVHHVNEIPCNRALDGELHADNFGIIYICRINEDGVWEWDWYSVPPGAKDSALVGM